MKEALIHYIWKVKVFDKQLLKTTDNNPLRILSFGVHNHHSGPDFSHAKIKLGDTTWSGHIEMHVNASDWYKHKHQDDPNYENVILHVVWNADKDVILRDGTVVPTLELKNRVDNSLLARYESLIHTQSWIPCAAQIDKVPQVKIPFWLKNLTIERLENKVEQLSQAFANTKGDWEQLFFQEIAKSFGLKQNADAFETLAASICIKYIYKHQDDLELIESMLFGQSSLIPEQCQDEYPTAMRKHHQFLAKKYILKPISSGYWKMARLRPPNFPTIRIAQLAYLYHTKRISFASIIYLSNREIIEVFSGVETSPYWQTHYQFDKEAAKKKKTLGESRKQIILINAVIPMLFFYGKHKKQEEYIEKSLQLLDLLKLEQNAIISKYKSLGIKANTAFDSQALLQLKKHYCDKKRCLECSIGHSILAFK